VNQPGAGFVEYASRCLVVVGTASSQWAICRLLAGLYTDHSAHQEVAVDRREPEQREAYGGTTACRVMDEGVQLCTANLEKETLRAITL
jgi:hypothetical protein